MNIDVFTFIARNTADYAEYLKHTAERFMSGKHYIYWKCIESVNVDRLPEGYDCVAKAKDMKHNSMNHAAALNLAQDYVEHDYVVFIDVDMAILYNNWDDVVVEELNKYDCFGGSYGHGSKYRNFPTVYFFTFRSYMLDKIKLDFSPKLAGNKESPCKYRIKNQIQADFFEMNVGDTIKCDTGWQLPLLVKGAGFKGSSMPMILMNSKHRLLPFVSDKNRKFCLQKPSHMCEWHYEKKLFATHKQACRNHALAGEWGQAWKKRIDLYMEKENG